MTNENPPATTTPEPALKWDQDAIYHVLDDRSRRGVLLTLAKDGPKTALELQNHARSTRNTAENRRNLMCKHLTVMREAGVVLAKENSKDRRQPIYYLSPHIRVTRLETEVILEFGFCTIRL
jgi:hypothetical protein